MWKPRFFTESPDELRSGIAGEVRREAVRGRLSVQFGAGDVAGTSQSWCPRESGVNLVKIATGWRGEIADL